MIFQYLPVERIHYGKNVVSEELIRELKKLDVKRILIVTTTSMLKSNSYKSIIDSLKVNHFLTLVTVSKQHVPDDVLLNDLIAIKEFNPNLIISCGGGSPIDAAKILSFVLSEGVQSENDLYLYSENVRKKKIMMQNYIPHFAIPTTLSASEFTGIAGVTSRKNHLKYKFSHLNMTPKQVFLDPTFTSDTPEWLWLSTGIRAVDHAVETLYSPIPNPVNTGLALQALKKLYYNLPLSKKHPANLDYRLECQVGAWLSLFSDVNIKLGLSHSIGHQLGAQFNIPHGMTSAIMLPHVMNFLLTRTYIQQGQIPEALGKATGVLSEDAEMASLLIGNLIKDLGIPHRLRDFDVPKESIPDVVKNILLDIHGEENSFVLDTKNLKMEITNLLEAAW
ncbi:iron-containing alcohol dehydrogenase [Psychrobacillus sp. OK032]|uniref:iron-containing alcohol dehydrogenase n=1 Tax=Psychrobacillus sp. OK032 TaxID=1884358 RepID=UPI0008AE6C2D|nr:iron-containing alcohol dehydrogenase [Psychrobacillus sp. OK032]SER86685.1 alcohol dehydrogenase [Psychrobacillus sp. OK032]